MIGEIKMIINNYNRKSELSSVEFLGEFF